MKELVKGLTLRHTKSGIPILRVHYSCDPDRDPDITPQWKERERRKYTSQAAWDREQEIVHNAGAGELVFAEVLNRFWEKIVITDSSFHPSPHWKKTGGYDHGKTNPSAALCGRIDFDGVIYILREYYSPGEPFEHVNALRSLDDFLETEQIMADPSIFYETQAQANGKFKAMASIYHELGIGNLRPAPENNELMGAERILQHWRDLDHREPTLKIVCPNYYAIQKQYGVHNDGCPNLLWELLRTRREKLSAQQLMRKNPTEAIVDKDNHARDALKYLALALPAPTQVPIELELARRVEGVDPTNAMITRAKYSDEISKRGAPIFVGGRASLKRQQWLSQMGARKHI